MYLFWSCRVEGVSSSLSRSRIFRAPILVSTSAYTTHRQTGETIVITLVSSTVNWTSPPPLPRSSVHPTFFKDRDLRVAEQRLGFLIVIDHHVIISLKENTYNSQDSNITMLHLKKYIDILFDRGLFHTWRHLCVECTGYEHDTLTF